MEAGGRSRLLDVFAMLWVGDILHVYALAALFLFPFRLLKPRWLVTLGLLFAAFTALGGVAQYVERATLQRDAAAVAAKVAAGTPLTEADRYRADDVPYSVRPRSCCS